MITITPRPAGTHIVMIYSTSRGSVGGVEGVSTGGGGGEDVVPPGGGEEDVPSGGLAGGKGMVGLVDGVG